MSALAVVLSLLGLMVIGSIIVFMVGIRNASNTPDDMNEELR